MFQALSSTLLQQSHLCPLPMYQQPLHWQLDHALRLYPLPHCLVLADSQPQQQCLFANTLCFNPVRTVGMRAVACGTQRLLKNVERTRTTRAGVAAG